MSRVANNPIILPNSVSINIVNHLLSIKGEKGILTFTLDKNVQITNINNIVSVSSLTESSDAIAGCSRAIIANMILGVSVGFQKKLELVGVGYRANVQGNILNLTLGFSHPVVYSIPTGITIQTPTQTEIIVNGMDKQLVGQVAAQIRAYRPPEPYKGKGVRYSNERILLKETKKK